MYIYIYIIYPVAILAQEKGAEIRGKPQIVHPGHGDLELQKMFDVAS